MFNPLQLSHRELRGLALLLVLLPIAPTALLITATVKSQQEQYRERQLEATAEQHLEAVNAVARFVHDLSSPAGESADERLLRFKAHLESELGTTLFAGKGKDGQLLLGRPLPEGAASIAIPTGLIADLPLESLRILVIPLSWEVVFPIGEIASLGVVIAGMLAGWAVNRQLKINQLENDSLAMIAHELKTPVASSRVMLESLAEGTVQGPEKTHEYLEILQSENKRMHVLIENFLTHAKLEGKGIALVPKPLEVSTLLEEVADIFQPRFEKRGGTFISVAPAEGSSVYADRNAVLRILGCLLDNALKHCTGDPEVIIDVLERGANTQIRVTDRGPGIPRHETAKIFDKFYQIDQRLERSRGGCGLGLAIARKLATTLHGNLTVTSSLGEGSCFTLSLPGCR